MLDFCQHGVPKQECGICRKELKSTPSIDFFEKPKTWKLEQIPVKNNFDLRNKLNKAIQPPEFKNTNSNLIDDLGNQDIQSLHMKKKSKTKKNLVESPELIDITKKFLKKAE